MARALLATPLRVVEGKLAPGLCSLRLRCSHAGAIAAELRRAPLFRGARISVRGDRLSVRGVSRWALASVQAAPRGVPGPFRLVRGSGDEIVAVRGGTRLVFRRLAPRAAVAALRAGRVDEAPVPLGDIRAAEADPTLHGQVRVRPIEALDLVELDPRIPLRVRRVYWQTVDRTDYQALVPEFHADVALGLVPGSGFSTRSSPSLVRKARSEVGQLPKVAVRIDASAELRYEADLVVANWLELGLGPVVGGASNHGDCPPAMAGGQSPAVRCAGPSRFLRVVAPYPRPDAIEKALGISDEKAYAASLVVPLAWVADARLVSPRLAGWREDVLGVPDYTLVRPAP